jgi:hypothetical protein
MEKMGKSKLNDVLLPSIGFGLGGLVAGFSGDFMLLGFLIMGVLGSVTFAFSQGYVQLKPVIKITIFGGIGFLLGFTIPLFVMLTMWEPPLKFLLTGVFGGGLGGIMIGLSIKKPGAVTKLGLGGAVGFGVGMLLFEFINTPLIFAITGLLGGAALGFASRHIPSK